MPLRKSSNRIMYISWHTTQKYTNPSGSHTNNFPLILPIVYDRYISFICQFIIIYRKMLSYYAFCYTIFL